MAGPREGAGAAGLTVRPPRPAPAPGGGRGAGGGGGGPGPGARAVSALTRLPFALPCLCPGCCSPAGSPPATASSAGRSGRPAHSAQARRLHRPSVGPPAAREGQRACWAVGRVARADPRRQGSSACSPSPPFESPVCCSCPAGCLLTRCFLPATALRRAQTQPIWRPEFPFPGGGGPPIIK